MTLRDTVAKMFKCDPSKVKLKSKQKPVSKENKVEFMNEKRAKELHRRGYNIGNIHAMMDSGRGKFSIRQIEKMVKKERSPEAMRLDGRL